MQCLLANYLVNVNYAPFLFRVIFACLPFSAALAGELRVTVTDIGGHPLEHAVVSLQPGEALRAPPGTKAMIDQRERRFAPTVLPIQTGTRMSFPNTDDVRHHVYSFSQPNSFEIKLYHGEPSSSVLFDQAGIVVLGCNIHDGMIGYLMVVDTPWFSSTSSTGKSTVSNVPNGDYTLQVWHPDLQFQINKQPVEITNTPLTLDITLETGAPVLPAKKKSPLQALFED